MKSFRFENVISGQVGERFGGFERVISGEVSERGLRWAGLRTRGGGGLRTQGMGAIGVPGG